MEVNEIKTLWQQTSGDQMEHFWQNEDNIRTLINNKSQSEIAVIKRTMVNKCWISGIVSSMAVVMSLVHLMGLSQKPLVFESYLGIEASGFLFLLMGIVIAGISIFNGLASRRINWEQAAGEPLKYALIRITEIFRLKINLETATDTIFTPLVAGIVSYLVLFGHEGLAWDIRVLYVVFITALVGIAAYFINRWLMQNRFNENLNRLENCLSDLHSLED